MVSIDDIRSKYEEELLSIEGVVGVGIGEAADKKPCIKVYVVKIDEKLKKTIPSELEGFPVELEEVGEIKAL
ncbi:hypothetical protein [Archaeoglobus veneficus]|uniref:Uncharacterized protein n=1 Tax=Archaeoglobus veneficus (strain DSM 11195 / SNP6) TaxID=693661 RepID=F2KNV8_ARCVS|nr:hypothetical protein [Archaeoglobus veneficus]AEA47435.1 hypothetical protein Arcve_1432 [Archaeoglobus veneficus SNP6]